MENLNHIKQLYKKYLDDRMSGQEKNELYAFFRQADDKAIDEVIDSFLEDTDRIPDLEHLSEVTGRVFPRVRQAISVKRHPWKWLAVAASVLIVGFAGLYFYNTNKPATEPQLTSKYGDDVLPGTNRATIAFGNGAPVELDEQDGMVVTHGTEVSYSNGELIHRASEVEMITLATPRGGQYRLTLPDGSKVWLNAESSITYPTHFADTVRRITFSGEGYFEVAQRTRQPFRISSSEQELTVLGTAFNVYNYPKETALTTLVGGSLRVSNTATGRQTILTPGEQAIQDGTKLTVKTVETSDYTAWKDGMMLLRDADFATVKRQLERWYDVSFVGEPAGHAKVSAILSRNVNLSDVLQSMEAYNGVKFKIEGRVIMVQ